MTIPGFVPKPRTKDVVCDIIEAEEGAPKLTATVRANLSFAEVDDLIALRNNADASYIEVWDVICRYIVGWNAVAFDNASGEYKPVPPPAEIGADAFRAVDKLVTSWLVWEMSGIHLGGDELEKKDSPSGDTPEPSAGGLLTFPPKTTKNRKRLKA